MSLAISPETGALATGRVLVVDDHANARDSLSDVLRRAGHDVQCCASGVEALERLSGENYDLVITDLMMPGMSGLEFMRHIQRRQLGVQVVMITAHATIGTAVEAMRIGAFDYTEKPFDLDMIEDLVGRAIAHGKILDRRGNLTVSPAGADCPMVGSSPAMKALRERIDQVAPTSETILITGESGTGKELVAQRLHQQSRRSHAPLIGLNCPVLSAHLLESELFGHERGAFTGADKPRIGRFELADGGTILLDEVTEIDLTLQAKLLRVLQERSFERVGSSQSIEVDVRVLATTNRDLKMAVAEGEFRKDLYYRLAVVPLSVPPLRDRREDIGPLTEHFLQRAAVRLQRDLCSLTSDGQDLLNHYHWPGNIRELQNLITRASVLNDQTPITADQLRPWLIDADQAEPRTPHDASAQIPVGLRLDEMERKLIEATLEHFDGHRARTAAALGIGIRTLSGKLKSYGYAPRTKQFSKAS